MSLLFITIFFCCFSFSFWQIFDKNSFEQLCINYANEKLQQIFNAHTFKMEEELYLFEGVPYANVAFIDNQEVLDLIEMRPHGLLVALDDELYTPQGSDAGFLSKADRQHGGGAGTGGSPSKAGRGGAASSPVTPRGFTGVPAAGGSGKSGGGGGAHPRYVSKWRTRNTFGVLHYAGEVEYTVDGFLTKCKDRMPEDLAHLMGESQMPLLAEVLFPGGTPGSIVHALAMLEHANMQGSGPSNLPPPPPPPYGSTEYGSPETQGRSESSGDKSERRR
jgi:hypothetical protein